MPIGRHLTRGPVGFLHVIGPLIAVCWLIGWQIKDANSALIWLYFIPPVAMTLFGAGWLVMAHGKTWRPARIFVFAVTMMAGAQMLAVDTSWHVPKAVGDPAIRLVQWNTARRYRKAPDIFKALSRDRPDICVLSESPRVASLYELGRIHLGLEHALDDQGMTIFSRFPVAPLGRVQITNGRASLVRVATPQGPLDILAFDMVSHPLLNRFQPMRELAHWVSQHDASIPLVIAGDFNTMRDSLAFNPLRSNLRNAYEEAGRGWPYSWPVPFPVYAIDHVWVSANVSVIRQSNKTSLLSDHRRQVVDLELRAGRGGRLNAPVAP